MKPRELAAAAVVALAIGALLPYVTLALGFGPNTSLLATFFGLAATSAIGARSRGALAASQAAGVAAGQTAFMGTALAALELLRRRGVLELDLHLTPIVVFAWLAAAGALGLLAALPLRRHYIEDERLAFAAGAAAGEAIAMLDDRDCTGAPRRRDHRAFALSLAGAAAATVARAPLSPLGIGSGLLVGPRIAASIALGAALAFALPARAAIGAATALLVAGGMTRAIVRLPSLARALACSWTWRAARGRWLAAAAGVAALCAIDRLVLATPVAATLVACAIAAPLVLVGTRVLGETNWAPVASLAAVAQAALAVVVPGSAIANVVGSTVAAAIPNSAQHAMQSFRAAAHCGTRARDTAIAHVIGVLAGAAMLGVTFPLLVARFGIGAGGLASPLGVAWANVTVAVTRGGDAIDLRAVAIGACAGVALALGESRATWLPSPVAVGIGLIVPWRFALAVGAGGAIDRTRLHRSPARVTVASGLVAGEALAATLSALAGTL